MNATKTFTTNLPSITLEGGLSKLPNADKKFPMLSGRRIYACKKLER